MAELINQPAAPAVPTATAATAAPRKRGRPRTNNIDDEQVPEKRRKQLREAQQTYRRRKETTINNLQTRVQELETGIEDLSQSFLSFSTLLLGANLLDGRSNIASALQTITQQCVSLARQGCSDNETESNQNQKQSQKNNQNQTQNRTPAQSVAGNYGEECLNQTTPAETINLDYDAEVVREEPILYSGNSTPQPSMTSTSSSLTRWSDMSLPLTPPGQDQSMLSYGYHYPSGPAPSLPSPPLTLDTKDTHLTISHRIVRECCRTGYRLLVYSPDNLQKIRQVFGGPLNESERVRLVSAFYNAMHDDYGEIVTRAEVLTPMHPRKNSYEPDQLSRSASSWQLVYEAGADEWLDASGVQRLLQEKGIDIVVESSASANSVYRMKTSPILFDISTFARLLSMDCICVGKGPAFRRNTVERALLLATSTDPWAYDTTSLDVPGFNF